MVEELNSKGNLDLLFGKVLQNSRIKDRNTAMQIFIN
jgi:hypothetical protein